MSDERIAGEIAVLATKADVSEELDRLRAHVETGRAYWPLMRRLGVISGFWRRS